MEKKRDELVRDRGLAPSSEEREQLKRGESVTKTLSVTEGNFRGEVTFSYSLSDGRLSCYTSQYRITRLNNQEGGNKANLNILVLSFPPTFVHIVHSPDAMWQDGEWHSYSRGALGGGEEGMQFVFDGTFIFDKSGPDPSGSGSIVSQL